mmetsp:Transcript_20915/g.38177  ORF Transcript_20915/g.38177 Transcript_20915/m.38177 type:complete len:128 (+) Transcript_20915:578-961(+)
MPCAKRASKALSLGRSNSFVDSALGSASESLALAPRGAMAVQQSAATADASSTARRSLPAPVLPGPSLLWQAILLPCDDKSSQVEGALLLCVGSQHRDASRGPWLTKSKKALAIIANRAPRPDAIAL